MLRQVPKKANVWFWGGQAKVVFRSSWQTPLQPQTDTLFVYILIVYMLIFKAVFIVVVCTVIKEKLNTPFHRAALKETVTLLYTHALFLNEQVTFVIAAKHSSGVVTHLHSV